MGLGRAPEGVLQQAKERIPSAERGTEQRGTRDRSASNQGKLDVDVIYGEVE